MGIYEHYSEGLIQSHTESISKEIFFQISRVSTMPKPSKHSKPRNSCWWASISSNTRAKPSRRLALSLAPSKIFFPTPAAIGAKHQCSELAMAPASKANLCWRGAPINNGSQGVQASQGICIVPTFGRMFGNLVSEVGQKRNGVRGHGFAWRYAFDQFG